jgi:hypothetical protein
MEHEELARILVLRAIADDYEDLDMIVKEVQEWADERGTSIAVPEILRNLIQAIETGMAKAYQLSAPYQDVAGVPDAKILAECYFRLTSEGVAEVTRLLPSVWIAADEDE